MSELQSKERVIQLLPRFKRNLNKDFYNLYHDIDNYMEKCGYCDDLHFTDKAIAIMLENSTWVTKLGYKLGLVKF